MELSPEILQIFEADSERIERLELTYKNGGRVLGTIRKLKLSPLRIVVQKSQPSRGERPRHRVVFDHLTGLKIVFNDGSEKDFT